MSCKPQARIVLRRKASFRRSAAVGPMGSSPLGAELLPLLGEPVLEHLELTPKEAADLYRDPEVDSIATAMPLKLIEPRVAAEPEVHVAGAPGNTWGVEAVGAHASPYDGEGVVVAVLDTGINPTHEAFRGVQLLRRNFSTGSDDDEEGHGTHCAGTLFGRSVDGLRIGVAPGVRKALVGKVLGPGAGSSATLAAAIQWAHSNGANVISMSLGIDFPGYVAYLVERQGLPIAAATSAALEQYRANVKLFSSLTLMLEQSSTFSQACIIVAASGNESDRPHYEIAVAPPAAGDGMIAVGALQRAAAGGFDITSFSNTQCNLCGPGADVHSAWIGGPQALKSISGTSMATPHVAGCAALWAQQIKQLTGTLSGKNLAAKLLASAQFVSGLGFDDIGNGMVQAPH